MHTFPVAFSIVSAPSRSKGWARYQAPAIGVRSSTGNAWVSANHSGEATEGQRFTLTLEVELNTGSGARARKERDDESFSLVAEQGAECDVKLIPGSQGLRLHIVGARLAVAS